MTSTINHCEFFLKKREKMAYTKDFGLKMLSTSDVAKYLSVSQITIRRAIGRGELKAFKTSPKGRFRVPMNEIEKYVQKFKT